MSLTYIVLLTLAVGIHSECNITLKVEPTSCCPFMPKSITPELIKSCDVKDVERFSEHSCKDLNCVMTKAKLLGSDNKVSRSKILDDLKPQYDPEWYPVLSSVVKKCLEMMDSKPDECESKQFSICVDQNLMAECPKELWTASPECDDAKKYVKYCY